ncbi:sensor histidine kinase [Agathobacter ruminis]|uniref:Histidine kinase/HSP90-like ATPase domain-containing protein n=1 Tax=Agathobacter ruminis TaxID=1712665 RepID=A0A2G3E2B3_9FIRM|nr:histidine kinase [Agathobacter ruminis]MDC7300613.1 histidine kinase [Agathobacter ruminis]PHU37243.1 hypothetical protein CSX02_09585 [Agathobacter ruminis]
MKLRTKFLIIYSIFAVIMISFTAQYVFIRYTELFSNQVSQIVDNIISNAASKTEDSLNDIRDTSMLFQINTDSGDTFIDGIKKYSDSNATVTSYDLKESRDSIKYICQNFLFTNKNINGIFIILPNNSSFGWGNNIDIKYHYDPTLDQWYQDTLTKHGKLNISTIKQYDFILRSTDCVLFSTALYDVATRKYLGTLLIPCRPELFNLSSINTLPNALNICIHETGKPSNVYYSNSDSVKTDSHSNHKYILTKQVEIPAYNLTIDAQIDLRIYTKNLTNVRMLLLGIILCMLVLVLLMYYPLSAWMIKPITRLTRHMRTTHLKKIPFKEKKNLWKDEISMLYTEYNNRIDSLNEYIQRDYQNKIIALDSQMRALEAQIDAHFLFNTLETINSIAEIEDVPRVSTISMALGNMFRYSIKTDSELVPLSDEINHVKDYVSIQSIRFHEKFTIDYDIPEALASTKVLKLILQPIVENCINHGFRHCLITGHIHIKARQEGDCLLLIVSDDGYGMDQATLNALKDRLAAPDEMQEFGKRSHQSIGVKNIHSRIRLYYGNIYGLQIESQKDVGTTVTICIPQIKVNQ